MGQPGRQAEGVPLEEPSAFVDYGGYTVVGKKRGTTAARKCKFVGDIIVNIIIVLGPSYRCWKLVKGSNHYIYINQSCKNCVP